MVYLGVNVIETDSKSTPAIAGAPTSVAGFVVRTLRGPTDEAIRVSSFRQFTNRFGSYHADFMGAYCLDGFFLNGGREAWIVRVVGGSPVAATATFRSGGTTGDGAPAGGVSFTLTAGYRGRVDVGAWSNDIRVNIEPSSNDFKLVVSLPERQPNTWREVETWEKLTLTKGQPNYIVTKINDDSSGSIYIRVAPESVGTTLPQSPTHVLLQTEPDVAPVPDDYRNALKKFDTVPIQLLAIPENLLADALETVTENALTYCANEDKKADCMFVGHTPSSRDAAKDFGADFQRSKVYGALYWPWITVVDPIGFGSNPTKVIPPTGHVMGVYARIDQTRGVWKAPAGNEAVVRGALAVEKDITDADHTDLVKNGSVNSIRQLRGTGIVIDSSRTLSTDPRWLYVNVRLLFNYVKASLKESLRWVKQEPNRETLWNKIKYNAITPFLLRLYQAGAFGPGKPEDVFTVICGPDNNPPDQIMLGNLQVEVYFNPGRPAETIIITIGQQDSGASASER
ncbi:hypothetical protein C8255_06055 [filamentous cyanobacterium CCP3]|nr:hypothetical protein C8255_06055 [filamentous cyanobacterium CCP3]